ncbi:carbohydrate kinase family protein [Thermoproteota archaeon]
MYDVITLGSAAMDVFIDTDSELLTIATPQIKAKHICYPSGSKILIRDVQHLSGGGGTNTAVSFARLGLKTAYLGNLGDDDNAKAIVDQLKKEKVKFIGTKGKDTTNFSIILDSIEHDRTILVKRDASDKLDFSKIDKKKVKARWLYMSSLIGKSYQTAIRLLAYAKKHKMKTAANISIYQAEQKVAKLKPLLKNIDVLIFNKEEAQAMLDTTSNDIVQLLKNASATGPEIVVITNGKEGAHCYDGSHYYFIKSSKLKVVESTGAGDAFASGFVASLAKGKDVEFSMKIALANSQSVVRYVGAKNKLLSWSAALKDIKAYKLKVRKKKV